MTPKGKRVLFFEREVKACYKSLMGDSCEGGYGIKLGPGCAWGEGGRGNLFI